MNKEREKLLKLIGEDLSSASSSPSRVSDDDDFRKEYADRDKLYTKLLDCYIEFYCGKSKRNKCYKKTFFYSILGTFLLIILATMTFITILALRGDTTIEDIGIVASGAAGMVSALIILPKIIAEHLFPKDEDKNMIGLVEKLQVNDTSIRTHFNKSPENNQVQK